MIYAIRMFKTMIKNESLRQTWETFKYIITLESLRFDLRMWYNIHFGKHYEGYSYTFKRNGYFVKDWRTLGWWFIPNDKTFRYGFVNVGDECKNGNVFIR